MKIKEHPEWSKCYPAIDGIAKLQKPSKEEINKILDKIPSKRVYYKEAENAIRSDIEKILKLSDVDFHDWYHERKDATEKMLKQYEIIASIPNLRYSSESQKLGLDALCYISDTIGVLKEGLDYLEKIKEVRVEYKEESKK